jgi:hypothetical protein
LTISIATVFVSYSSLNIELKKHDVSNSTVQLFKSF